jgi:starvation-inducible DNA-binding protein
MAKTTQQATQRTVTNEAVIIALNREVANAVALYLNYKKYHWHVSGPLFRDLHLLFDEHAAQVLATVDELGERVRMLGGIAAHHPNQITELASVQLSAPNAQSPREMIAEALANHQTVITGMHQAIDTSEEARDPGTMDLFTRLVQIHEKQAWFLREVAARDSNLLA